MSPASSLAVVAYEPHLALALLYASCLTSMPQHTNYHPAFHPRYRWLFNRYSSHLPTFGLCLQILLESTGLSFWGTAEYHSWSLPPWLHVAPSLLSLVSPGPFIYCGNSCCPAQWLILTAPIFVDGSKSDYSVGSAMFGGNLTFSLCLPVQFSIFFAEWEPSLVFWVMSLFVVYLEPSFIPTP